MLVLLDFTAVDKWYHYYRNRLEVVSPQTNRFLYTHDIEIQQSPPPGYAAFHAGSAMLLPHVACLNTIGSLYLSISPCHVRLL